MSDRFYPISADQLVRWVFTELQHRDSVFGIPRQHFFVPRRNDTFITEAFGKPIGTPFGPAAGPHSQMAQNIIAAWLCGSRYIELKTVQTLDELEVSKPCIDMEDEGYNVEWSQELKVHQSFDEYLRAWVLIHALHHRLGFPGHSPAVVFNLSVGYDLAGIQKPNMQWFLDQARDCSAHKQAMIDQVAAWYPPVRDLDIPDCMSDNITLSTMHGCPPDEIGSICSYLIKERGFHTFVKCNPTLLGPERVRGILTQDLGFSDVVVPDIAFEHDLKFDDAIPLLKQLRCTARDHQLEFGIKLSNTLEVENFRSVFDSNEQMMYLSGRPLHAITVRLASEIAGEFSGELPMSFSAGADCFNAPQLLAAGMQTITVCSDFLKTGGYLRLLQYLENTRSAIEQSGASGIKAFILSTANAGEQEDPAIPALGNLRDYAAGVCTEPRLKKEALLTSKTKTARALNLFDCIDAPCTTTCAIQQKVPQYMQAVREGNYDKALELTRADNPIPVLLGRTCDHLCEPACIRTHLDEPLAIRHIKRFIMEHEDEASLPSRRSDCDRKIAIIGAGPGGLAAASELAKAGAMVEIFEQHGYAGGMVGGAIPEYRLPNGVINQDIDVLKKLGVVIHFNQRAGRNFTLSELNGRGFDSIVITVGAQLGKKLGLDGEDCEGVIDALEFLRQSREGHPPAIGPRIGIIGAGDTAMDCARTAWRRSGDGVSIIYRRSLEQMPADREEIRCLLEEGIGVTGMAKPTRLLVENGRLRGLSCTRMEYRGDRDESGRKIPHEIPDDVFDVPLDTLILAISQNAMLDFFEEKNITLNKRGFIDVNPQTFETSLPGVYAGGDVVNDGPSSIVEAAADGKAIAASILGRPKLKSNLNGSRPVDTTGLILRRSRREWRVGVPHTPASERKNFNEVVLGYSEEQARKEAGRCLDCHEYCSVCVGVCPNLAIQTIETQPFECELPELRAIGGQLEISGSATFSLSQPYQVAVLADLCNECGNCTTFCPTAGAPYRDKPRLYLDRQEFDAQHENAFMVIRDNGQWAMESRWSGQTHRLEVNEQLEYSTPHFSAHLDPDSFSLVDSNLTAEGSDEMNISLVPFATMFALLSGIRSSMAHLPGASPTDHKENPA